MGLGRHGGGVGAARYLAELGARVTVTDLANERTLADSLRELSGVPIEQWRLGSHEPDDFRHADAVVVNPAVRPDHPLVAEARTAGATVTTEVGLFLDVCPARTIGVTGTTGKSSTATMIASILQASGRRTWLGGNIGGSLLGQLPAMRTDDVAVLEFSSFQLYWMPRSGRMPEVAVITNFSPNHLDWHPTLAHYAHAKQRLIAEQRPGDTAILNLKDEDFDAWKSVAAGNVARPLDDGHAPPLAVLGRHQRQNAECASAAAKVFGCSEDAFAQALSQFRPLPHRLQAIAEIDGRTFYNDSKSTTPAATIAALAACGPKTWLLAGGRAKRLDLTPLAVAMTSCAIGAGLFGECAAELHERLSAIDPKFGVSIHATLPEALAWCWRRSAPGDAILLSPGCASLDQYHDYQARGEHFIALVNELKR
jgi:UDP-N-acetylmuramoylalanine--D-glutamate ligase